MLPRRGLIRQTDNGTSPGRPRCGPRSISGVYANFLGEEDQERTRSAYQNRYDRLVALKNAYDPTNFFRLNQNIRPTV